MDRTIKIDPLFKFVEYSRPKAEIFADYEIFKPFK